MQFDIYNCFKRNIRTEGKNITLALLSKNYNSYINLILAD